MSQNYFSLLVEGSDFTSDIDFNQKTFCVNFCSSVIQDLTYLKERQIDVNCNMLEHFTINITIFDIDKCFQNIIDKL